jgi:hypothetical protein
VLTLGVDLAAADERTASAVVRWRDGAAEVVEARLGFGYRHFEDDDRPFEIKESGFRHLDRVIEECGRHGICSVIDPHALPGAQSTVRIG